MEFLAASFSAFAALGILGAGAILLALAVILFGAFFEKGFVAFLGLAALAGASVFFGGAHPWDFACAHPLLLGGGFLAYFVIGAFWSVAKFRLYTGGLKFKFRDFTAAHLAHKGLASIDQLDPAALDDYRKRAALHMASITRSHIYPAMPSDHKADILFWMGWWPTSMIAYALDEPIKRLLEALYRAFSGVYVKIAKEQSAEFTAAMGL